MINKKSKILTVLKKLDVVGEENFTEDHTKNAWNFASDSFALTLASTDYLYIGYRKQLWQYYVELDTPNTNASELTVEKYNGTTWEVVEHFDETDGFSQSGFIYLTEEHGGLVEGGDQNIYIRISVNTDTSAMSVRGINLVFCNKDDLLVEEPSLDRYYPKGQTSAILAMEAATTFIIDKINSAGIVKYNGVQYDLFTRFDLFDVLELRNACKFYALYKLMSNRQDTTNDDDVRYDKAIGYLTTFNNVFEIFNGQKLSLDLNDDGETDANEEAESIEPWKFER